VESPVAVPAYSPDLKETLVPIQWNVYLIPVLLLIGANIFMNLLDMGI